MKTAALFSCQYNKVEPNRSKEAVYGPNPRGPRRGRRSVTKWERQAVETAAGKAPPGANVTFSSRCARPAKGDRGHLAPVSARFGGVGAGTGVDKQKPKGRCPVPVQNPNSRGAALSADWQSVVAWERTPQTGVTRGRARATLNGGVKLGDARGG